MGVVDRGEGPEHLPRRERRGPVERPDLRRVRDGSVMLCLYVDLEHSFPPVWRRLEVSGDLRLDQLHEVVNQAMGWDDVHLHGFRSAFRGDAGVVMPTLLTDAELDDADHADDADDAVDALDTDHTLDAGLRGDVRDLRSATGVGSGEVHESQVRVGEVLADVGDVLHYDYDMACGWRHVISVEGVRARAVGEARVALLAGERACPPEDCGGVWTYNDIVAVLTGEPVEGLQTHPDDVLDQIDWLPEEFDPEAFDLPSVRERVEAVDLFDLPPPMPPLTSMTAALADLAGSCDTKGRRALALLLADAGLDALSLLEAHRSASAAAPDGRGLVVVDTSTAFRAGGGPGAPLPPELDDAACLPLVAPFRALLDAIDHAPGGVRAGEDCPFPQGLVTAAVALKLVACSRGRLRRHSAPESSREATASPRALATLIARHLPLGEVPHEIDAGTLALLCAASGVTKHEIVSSGMQGRTRRVAGLCHTIIEDAGWRTRAGRVSEETVAFWADETWSVLSLLSGGDGFAPHRHPSRGDAAGFPGGRVPAAVRSLARAALRISGPS